MIRPASAQDAPALAGIYNHYIANTIITFETEAVSPQEMATRIAHIQDAALPWLVIENEQGVFGWAYAAPWRARPAYRHSVETTVYLAPQASGRGFGRLIYAQLLDYLRQAGLHTAIGGIALPNPASIRLHEALGFVKAAQFSEVGYKFGRWVDVGFWQIKL